MQPNALQFTPPIDSIPLSDGILFTFYAVAAAYVLFTAIFYYHWNQYSSNKKVTWITYIIYLVTTLPIVLFMTALAFTI